MRKLTLTFLIVMVALWATIWLGVSAIAPRLVRTTLSEMMERTEKLGIRLADVSFSGIRISPLLDRATLTDLRARIDLSPRDQIQLKSEATIQAVELRLQDLFRARGSVHAMDLEVRLDPSDLPNSLPYGWFTNAELAITDLPLTQPRQAAQLVKNRLKHLFTEDQLEGKGHFTGDVQVDIGGSEWTVRLYTERRGDHLRLRVRANDVQTLAERMNLDLAPEQVEIVSLYPMRLPVILGATLQARDLAKRHAPSDAWLRDAHRHVTWSYLLTRRFGAEFAQTVTDAHETKTGNTPDERAMDFHNNAVGRRLAASGEKLAALPSRVRNDPDIIRHPDQVASFGEARLLH